MEESGRRDALCLMHSVNAGSFDLLLPRRIRFGRGTAQSAAEMTTGFGKRVLVVLGKNAVRSKWLLDDLQDRSAEVHCHACDKEPDLSLLERAIGDARAFSPDVVVAIGGGAVLDLGKAVAALVNTKGNVVDYLEVVGKGLPLDADKLPFIALPTTAGTGSEVTRNAVIGIPKYRRKVSLRDNRMIADVVIVDPQMTDESPRNVTLASGLDAITQLIEPYICTRANAFTDSLILEALPGALNSIRVLARNEDPGARDAMAWASLCGGLALANSGLGAVHGLAGVIGGMTEAPHGEICASLLPAVLDMNSKVMHQNGVDTTRIDHVANLLGHEFNVSAGQAFASLAKWSRGAGIRSILELGLQESEFESAAEASLSSSSMRANPVSLAMQHLMQILLDSR